MSWKACAFVKELRVNITQTEKFVLLLLAECHNNVHKIAWPSVKNLAEDALLSERQTIRVLASLESKGFIRRSKSIGGHITTCYEILGMEGCQNVTPAKNLGVTLEASRGDIRGDISDSVIRKEPVLELENRLILPLSSGEVIKKPDIIDRAFKHFVALTDKTKNYTLTPKRRKMAESRWKEALSMVSADCPPDKVESRARELFGKAMDALIANDWMRDNGFWEWEQIFRSAENFQKWIDRFDNPPEIRKANHASA